MTRIAASFGALILAQSAHSVEEYAGRLWESFPPARFVSGLVSTDLERGFVIANILLVAFGFWCWLWPVRRGVAERGPAGLGLGNRRSREWNRPPALDASPGRLYTWSRDCPILLVLALYLATQLRAQAHHVPSSA